MRKQHGFMLHSTQPSERCLNLTGYGISRREQTNSTATNLCSHRGGRCLVCDGYTSPDVACYIAAAFPSVQATCVHVAVHASTAYVWVMSEAHLMWHVRSGTD